MELLVAALIAFGVVNSGDADKLVKDPAKVKALVEESGTAPSILGELEDF